MSMTTVAVVAVLVVGFVLVRIQLKRERIASEARQQQASLQDSRERIANLVSVRRKTTELALEHRQELARRRLELVQPDGYGIVDWAPWHKELNRFTDTIVKPCLTARESRFTKVVKRIIDDIALVEAQEILARGEIESAPSNQA
jgi:hypothetical protein